MIRIRIALLAMAVLLSSVVSSSFASDWKFWGRNENRNMVSPEKGIPDDFFPGEFKKGSEEIDMSTTKNIKWVQKLGSQAYGNVTVANGKIFIGTNNESPRDPKYKGDHGVVMCFDEATGKFLWQLMVPKLGAGKVSDWEYLGICSSPAVDENRVYVVTNRCAVICLDVNGMADGNDGPYKDESLFVSGDGNPPIEQGKTDADIIWRFDMRDELGVFPHNISSSSVLVIGDRVYATTSNGQDWSHLNIPSPFAPTLCVLDKHTGELIGEEASGISQRIMHSNWSSPSYAEVNGKGEIIFGAGDGHVYGFDPAPIEGDDGIMELKELWRVNIVPKEYFKHKYPAYDGPSEIIGTPVFYNGKIYAGIGQDPEHGDGVGNYVCIDPTKTGDGEDRGIVWSNQEVTRTISTASIADGLVYISDYAGRVHCLDANTGKTYWVFDTQSHVWSSTLLVDGKVFICNEDGFITVLKAGKEKKMIREIDMLAPVYSTPVVANGVMYIATQTHLFAIAAQ